VIAISRDTALRGGGRQGQTPPDPPAGRCRRRSNRDHSEIQRYRTQPPEGGDQAPGRQTDIPPLQIEYDKTGTPATLKQIQNGLSGIPVATWRSTCGSLSR